MPQSTVDVNAFFDAPQLDPKTLDGFADQVYSHPQDRERFEVLVNEARNRADVDPLRLGQALLVGGHFADALKALERAPDSKERRYYSAQANLALGRVDAALADLQGAAAKGWDSFLIDMEIAGLQVRRGDGAAANKLAHKHAAHGQDRGEWQYVQGLLSQHQDNRENAIELFEKALTLSPDNADAMFRCAWLYDMRGDDEQAIELYQRLSLQPRAFVNALINLAVIYEDLGRYDAAIECLRRVLNAYPNHTRARLFMKDVESCRGMVIDEGGESRPEPRNRMLDTPIGEFELSVRARNCLKKMKINTLGDLLRLSEPELLAYKNFGETSLNEIKALLGKKGLRLGQPADEIEVEAAAPVEVAPPKVNVPPGREAILHKPVSEMELSVRARRCLQRLNIASLGDLIQRSENELLSTRNFGVTSLNEIKARLADHGLSLANKRPE